MTASNKIDRGALARVYEQADLAAWEAQLLLRDLKIAQCTPFPAALPYRRLK